MRSENRSSSSITESDLFALGGLICDIPSKFIDEIPNNIGVVAIDLFKNCLSR